VSTEQEERLRSIIERQNRRIEILEAENRRLSTRLDTATFRIVSELEPRIYQEKRNYDIHVTNPGRAKS